MTEVNLDSIFSSLDASASQLNTASETANNALVDAETRLIDLKIGIEVWHNSGIAVSDLTGDVGPHDTRERVLDLLGFARVDGKWCFAVKRVRQTSGFYDGDLSCPYTDEFLESPPAPLLNQSRSIRINALALLPEFLEQVTDEVRSATSKLTKTINVLAS